MTIIAVRLWEIIKRHVASNSPPTGQDDLKGYCPLPKRRPHSNNFPHDIGGLDMSAPVTHVLGNWPVVVAAVTGFGLLVAVVRYKIPELVKKIDEMEKGDFPSNTDLKQAFENFRTICKFNQVSCQKGIHCELDKVKTDIDAKLGALYELVHAQAVLMARVDERVAALHGNNDPAFQPPKAVIKQ